MLMRLRKWPAIELTQDGTGSRTMTLPTGTNGVKWPAAYAAGDKLLTTTASARDMVAYFVAETSVIYARISTGFA